MSKLLLLDDVPAGRGAPDTVAFNHKLYSGLLRDVLLDNRSGICVGFFARWGQGKSTVINILQAQLGDRADLILFNAYQARGDSVRRQMLLSILKEIDPEQAEEFQRFTQVATPLEMQTVEVQQNFEGGRLAKLMLRSKVDVPFTVLACATVLSSIALGWYFPCQPSDDGCYVWGDVRDRAVWRGVVGAASRERKAGAQSRVLRSGRGEFNWGA